jgi:hypothetical protein
MDGREGRGRGSAGEGREWRRKGLAPQTYKPNYAHACRSKDTVNLPLCVYTTHVPPKKSGWPEIQLCIGHFQYVAIRGGVER